MAEDWLTALAASAWALPILFALVLGDAFLVVVPGEIALAAFGALAVSTGTPPLGAVLVVGAVAAVCGDAACYAVGRLAGLERWRWMRAHRVRAAFAWARTRIHERTGVVLFTARFIPFARLAVNLVAGASRVHAARYLAVAAVAATGWAAYQTLVGAVVAAIVPGGPVVAVVVSVVIAIGVGLAVDGMLARAARREPR
ncbi:DedA family protein [Microbacterium ulmi]|uniref:VTT domain-containing protein n=1 Tax=Microbacterium ulmi TaxID=179095 RepID=A0A7Y2M1B1_9MICO|nr:VTT domain-containing protein [Microbacterium ulmi]NII70585.1 membrane protein DedA with SNARE-associated domain [Microbacterium ulmi]NNH04174.1 hypothetical protein [Microbacterium ulmi]